MITENVFIISGTAMIIIIIVLAICAFNISDDYYNNQNIKECVDRGGSWIHQNDVTSAGHYNCVIK